MENTRKFLRGLAGAAACGLQGQTRPLVIDAHCHAGLGQEMTAPWTTNGDLGITLRHMEEAGIDRTIIFPINNPTYEKANQSIAEMCGRYPGKLIGLAVKELGPDKIIFGSDGPEQDSRVELYKIRLLKLPPADEAKILSGNILRLLPKGSV